MATHAKTYPDFSRSQPREIIWRMAEMANTPSPELLRQMEPAVNPRYPGYAGITEDARFGTDYRPHCNSNIPPPYQFDSKKWMIHNADVLMNESRRRQAEYTGAGFINKNIPMPVPGFEFISNCTPFKCEIEETDTEASSFVGENNNVKIGLYRGDGGTVPLFGTFVAESTVVNQIPRKKIDITTKYEGGRNTPRGSNNFLHGAG